MYWIKHGGTVYHFAKATQQLRMRAGPWGGRAGRPGLRMVMRLKKGGMVASSSIKEAPSILHTSMLAL